MECMFLDHMELGSFGSLPALPGRKVNSSLHFFSSVCVCVCVCVCVRTRTHTLWVMSDSLQPYGIWLPRILQARILEWGAISSSRGSSQPRDWTRITCISCIGSWILYPRTTWEASSAMPLHNCQDDQSVIIFPLFESEVWVTPVQKPCPENINGSKRLTFVGHNLNHQVPIWHFNYILAFKALGESVSSYGQGITGSSCVPSVDKGHGRNKADGNSYVVWPNGICSLFNLPHP